MSRISVIGAGIAGMCAAARLSRLGHKVEVFEASDRVGGKCRTTWMGDLAFDTGPTHLTLPAVFRDFFLKTGAPMESVIKLEPVNPSFDYKFVDGSSVQFTNLSRHETLKAIENSFGVRSSSEWSELMKRASDMWDVSRTPFIESEQSSILSLMKSRTLIRDAKTIAPWKSLQSLVSSQTSDYRLKYILERYATYSGSDPRKAPAALLSIAYIEEAFGAWHIAGGVGTLAEAIFQRAVETGVTFHLNAKVKEIKYSNNRISGLVFDDESEINSEIIVANADASTIYTTLLPGTEKELRAPRKTLRKTTPSLGGFSIYLGSKPNSTPPKISHHTVLFPEQYTDEFVSIFDENRPAPEPAIYICAPQDPAMTKNPTKAGWSILVNVPHHSTEKNEWNWSDPHYSRQYAGHILDQMELRGVRVRENMELLMIQTPADMEAEVLAPGGSIYGTSSNGARAAFRRTRNRSPLNGLYCVGGSAHPGGGLPLVAMSAEIVAGIIGRA